MTSKTIGKDVSSLLSALSDDVYDPMPAQIVREQGLCHLRFALQNIHFPKDRSALGCARDRLIFEEFLTLQLGLLRLKSRNRKETSAVIPPTDLTPFTDALPFTLTGAQQRAVREALADMNRTTPMNRLVQGDVGSGKTAVAAAPGCYAPCQKRVADRPDGPHRNSGGAALPHLTGHAVPLRSTGLALLTGAMTARSRRRRSKTRSLWGNTRTWWSAPTPWCRTRWSFARLGLVITDEQHRFGVGQRGLADPEGGPTPTCW